MTPLALGSTSLELRLMICAWRLLSFDMVFERLLDRFAMLRFWLSSRAFVKDKLAPEVDAVSSVVFSRSFSFSLDSSWLGNGSVTGHHKCCDAQVKESMSSESSFGLVSEELF